MLQTFGGQNQEKQINKGMQLGVPGKEHHSGEGSCDQPLGAFQLQFEFFHRCLPLQYLLVPFLSPFPMT